MSALTITEVRGPSYWSGTNYRIMTPNDELNSDLNLANSLFNSKGDVYSIYIEVNDKTQVKFALGSRLAIKFDKFCVYLKYEEYSSHLYNQLVNMANDDLVNGFTYVSSQTDLRLGNISCITLYVNFCDLTIRKFAYINTDKPVEFEVRLNSEIKIDRVDIYKSLIDIAKKLISIADSIRIIDEMKSYSSSVFTIEDSHTKVVRYSVWSDGHIKAIYCTLSKLFSSEYAQLER